MLSRERLQVEAGRASVMKFASAFREGWPVAAEEEIGINLLRVRIDCAK